MNPEVLLENISNLPPVARQEVFDFVDFLLQKYKSEIAIQSNSETRELSDAGKKFIDSRLEQMKSNPKMKTWKEIKQNLALKHNW